ncbi:MAG: nitroreductase family protein [Candidatus Heimdallarchaeota archaeon]|nr:nitroreductase family protein [Candidatus Heimdallarchaeota archaeon]
MSFDEIIANRRSIRKFKKDPVKEEHIEAILDAGNKAPSAKNLQHWRFHVYQKEAKDKLVKFCLEEFDKISGEPGVHPYARYSFQIMDQAPVAILVFSAQVMEHPARPDIQSVSAAIQNMLLKAQELGLGSLWICDVLYIDKTIMTHLGTEMPLLAAVSLGYPNESPESRTRLTVDDITTWFE